ncbi:MAG TPA: hypothetical protein PLV45_14540, partial [bacterium]|nr:hypothetical protein [bacterium]
MARTGIWGLLVLMCIPFSAGAVSDGDFIPVTDIPVDRDFSWWPFPESAPYSRVENLHAGSVIRLDAGSFDTRDGDMPLPDGLRAPELQPGETGMYVIQFTGPVTEAQKDT